MNTTTKRIGIVAIVVIVLALLGFLVWRERASSEMPSAVSTSTAATASSSTAVSITVSSTTAATTTGGYTITPITTSNVPTSPNYRTPLSFSADISADEQAQDQSQFQTVQTTLASNPTDYDAWLELGILRKETGDYQGAAADWKYVTELYPNDPTAYANLGDLYSDYLHQDAQGIAYYKEAIKADPTQEASLYENLATVYESQGDKADARLTLEQGIDAKVVGYQNLQQALAQLQ